MLSYIRNSEFTSLRRFFSSRKFSLIFYSMYNRCESIYEVICMYPRPLRQYTIYLGFVFFAFLCSQFPLSIMDWNKKKKRTTSRSDSDGFRIRRLILLWYFAPSTVHRTGWRNWGRWKQKTFWHYNMLRFFSFFGCLLFLAMESNSLNDKYYFNPCMYPFFSCVQYTSLLCNKFGI